MRVFIQDDDTSNIQFVELGRNSRPIIENIVSTLFGEKYSKESYIERDEVACEVPWSSWAGGRTTLAVQNDAMDSLISALEVIGAEIVFVVCYEERAVKFHERLYTIYDYSWEDE
jgi:cytolysin (calcineurin-like family phosphatase)